MRNRVGSTVATRAMGRSLREASSASPNARTFILPSVGPGVPSHDVSIRTTPARPVGLTRLPAGGYWPFQFYETALFVVLAHALAGMRGAL